MSNNSKPKIIWLKSGAILQYTLDLIKAGGNFEKLYKQDDEYEQTKRDVILLENGAISKEALDLIKNGGKYTEQKKPEENV